jgi:hypothetical protein
MGGEEQKGIEERREKREEGEERFSAYEEQGRSNFL